MTKNAEYLAQNKQKLKEDGKCRVEIRPYKHQKPIFKQLERLALDDPEGFERRFKRVDR